MSLSPRSMSAGFTNAPLSLQTDRSQPVVLTMRPDRAAIAKRASGTGCALR